MPTHRRTPDRRSYARPERLRAIVPRGAPTVSARRSPTFAEPRRTSATHEHEHGQPRSASYPERERSHHSAAVGHPSPPAILRMTIVLNVARPSVGRSVGRSARPPRAWWVAVRQPTSAATTPEPDATTPRRHDVATQRSHHTRQNDDGDPNRPLSFFTANKISTPIPLR
jgi:hypothetical protein